MFDKKEMFKAVCGECNKPCEVPFKPTGDKPVLCSDCFAQKKDRFHSRTGAGRSARSRDRHMHEAICDKCGKKCQVPFKPTGEKPIFCSDCFSTEDRRSDRRGDRRGRDRYGRGSTKSRDEVGSRQLSEQLKSVSLKVDKVLELLEREETEKQSSTKTIGKKASIKKAGAKTKTAKNSTKKAAKKTPKKKK